jgi:hypothetical protein
LEQRGPLEDVYRAGRDLAVFMSARLVEFNVASSFPTLKLFVDSFIGSWTDQLDILKEISRLAKDVSSTLESPPWAVGQMIALFDKQIEILQATRQTIDRLKSSETYRWESGQTELVVRETDYNRILECINMIGQMFERLPSTYAGKEEEHLRDHILVTLQAAVLGAVTGETFNKRGKTDILVKSASGGRNEFVGECKFWRGEGAYLGAIDQLLSYLSWRDDKTAIILFVPNKEFSGVLEKIRESTTTHARFAKYIGSQSDSFQLYEFRLPDDNNRVIQLAVLAFHMPTEKTNSSAPLTS